MQLWDSMFWPYVNPVPSGAVGKDCQRRLLSRPRFFRACSASDFSDLIESAFLNNLMDQSVNKLVDLLNYLRSLTFEAVYNHWVWITYVTRIIVDSAIYTNVTRIIGILKVTAPTSAENWFGWASHTCTVCPPDTRLSKLGKQRKRSDLSSGMYSHVN
jgi:hypothetical protein